MHPRPWQASPFHSTTADMSETFDARRARQNELVLGKGSRTTKRFFNLDTAAYDSGALPASTKELMGLVASLVLRCNDCITYHVLQAKRSGVSEAEFVEACDVALIVGGSIVIPHLRSAYEVWHGEEQE